MTAISFESQTYCNHKIEIQGATTVIYPVGSRKAVWEITTMWTARETFAAAKKWIRENK